MCEWRFISQLGNRTEPSYKKFDYKRSLKKSTRLFYSHGPNFLLVTLRLKKWTKASLTRATAIILVAINKNFKYICAVVAAAYHRLQACGKALQNLWLAVVITPLNNVKALYQKVPKHTFHRVDVDSNNCVILWPHNYLCDDVFVVRLNRLLTSRVANIERWPQHFLKIFGISAVCSSFSHVSITVLSLFPQTLPGLFVCGSIAITSLGQMCDPLLHEASCLLCSFIFMVSFINLFWVIMAKSN